MMPLDLYISKKICYRAKCGVVALQMHTTGQHFVEYVVYIVQVIGGLVYLVEPNLHMLIVVASGVYQLGHDLLVHPVHQRFRTPVAAVIAS